jgi:hypothetical protein
MCGNLISAGRASPFVAEMDVGHDGSFLGPMNGGADGGEGPGGD